VTLALVGTVLVASLAGSLHCAGMCGGFVAFWAGADAGRTRWAPHAAYGLGRLLTYATFGALAGAVGAALDLAGEQAGLSRAAALVAGLLMIAWGLAALGSALGWRVPGLRLPASLASLARRAHAAAARRPPVARAFLVGLLTTVLPCGWLHAFTITAAGTGSPLAGVAVMSAFWLGTLPVLSAVGAGVQALAAPLRRHVPVVSALLILTIGLLALAGRAPLPWADGPAPPCHVDG
jgi:sulfite exporter TauE/SafE